MKERLIRRLNIARAHQKDAERRGKEYLATYWEGQADAVSAILSFEFDWEEGEG